MLTWASLSRYPTGVFVHGVEDCMVASAGEAPEHPLHLKEGLLLPLKSSTSNTLMGDGIWLPKDTSARNLVIGEEDVDPGTHGNVG